MNRGEHGGIGNLRDELFFNKTNKSWLYYVLLEKQLLVGGEIKYDILLEAKRKCLKMHGSSRDDKRHNRGCSSIVLALTKNKVKHKVIL